MSDEGLSFRGDRSPREDSLELHRRASNRFQKKSDPHCLEKRQIMVFPVTQFSPYTSLFSFLIGLPAMIGAYYQSWKARQEARLAREGALQSMNCLEFVVDDGTCINLVPLETLHSLPKPGDVVLLPGGRDERFGRPCGGRLPSGPNRPYLYAAGREDETSARSPVDEGGGAGEFALLERYAQTFPAALADYFRLRPVSR